MVLESAMIMPWLRDDSTPLGPNNRFSTAPVSATHIHTTSAPCAASAGEAAGTAPSGSLPGVRFHTLTVWPALTRLAAIGLPMIPKPKKATCISALLIRIRPRELELTEPPRSSTRTGLVKCSRAVSWYQLFHARCGRFPLDTKG